VAVVDDGGAEGIYEAVVDDGAGVSYEALTEDVAFVVDGAGVVNETVGVATYGATFVVVYGAGVVDGAGVDEDGTGVVNGTVFVVVNGTVVVDDGAGIVNETVVDNLAFVVNGDPRINCQCNTRIDSPCLTICNYFISSYCSICGKCH